MGSSLLSTIAVIGFDGATPNPPYANPPSPASPHLGPAVVVFPVLPACAVQHPYPVAVLTIEAVINAGCDRVRNYNTDRVSYCLTAKGTHCLMSITRVEILRSLTGQSRSRTSPSSGCDVRVGGCGCLRSGYCNSDGCRGNGCTYIIIDGSQGVDTVPELGTGQVELVKDTVMIPQDSLVDDAGHIGSGIWVSQVIMTLALRYPL